MGYLWLFAVPRQKIDVLEAQLKSLGEPLRIADLKPKPPFQVTDGRIPMAVYERQLGQAEWVVMWTHVSPSREFPMVTTADVPDTRGPSHSTKPSVAGGTGQSSLRKWLRRDMKHLPPVVLFLSCMGPRVSGSSAVVKF